MFFLIFYRKIIDFFFILCVCEWQFWWPQLIWSWEWWHINIGRVIGICQICFSWREIEYYKIICVGLGNEIWRNFNCKYLPNLFFFKKILSAIRANHIGLSFLCNEIWRNFNIKIEQEVRGYVQAFLCNLAKISNPQEKKSSNLFIRPLIFNSI